MTERGKGLKNGKNERRSRKEGGKETQGGIVGEEKNVAKRMRKREKKRHKRKREKKRYKRNREREREKGRREEKEKDRVLPELRKVYDNAYEYDSFPVSSSCPGYK